MTQTTYFDPQKWDQLIKKPNWYMSELFDEADGLIRRADQGDPERHAIKKAVRSYFEDRLERGMVALGDAGENLDAERKPIDTLVIHHTAGPATNYEKLSYLNAVQLLRIYAPAYRTRDNLQGKSLWSGHFYEGKQVFWGYHWFIFGDGSCKQILPDTAVGWHSGSWDVNTRSIGICLAGNFMQEPPSEAMLTTAQQIIREHYADPAIRIIGHKETPRDTTCPGDTFARWRQRLRASA